MRYLILANNSGGLYRFRKELMARLIDDSHEVYAVTPFDQSIDELQAMGVNLIEQHMNRRGTNPLQEAKLLLGYYKILKKISPDIVITYTIKPGIYGGLLSRWLHIPYAVNITGLGTAFQNQGMLRTIIVRLWRAALKSAKCVFFENQENAQIFIEYGIVKREQTHVLHGAGVNLSDFPYSEYPEERSTTRFLFVGRVMKEKGIEELLAALELLDEAGYNARLDIVGWCEEDYEKRLADFQERGLLEFHGFQTDVKPFIRSAHAFVLPSYHEGMANTLLEAAAMGRPLITSAIHGCMEAVIDGETGFLCTVQDTDSLTKQLERFIDLPYEQKRKMGKKSHEHVAKYFDKSKVVEETVEVLYDKNIY